MIVAPLIPIITTLNTVYQQQRKRDEARRQQQKEEYESNYRNYNGTSCARVVNDTEGICCFYPPLPPETPATMVCNVLSR